MILAIIYTAAIVCFLRLAIAWLMEIDEHGDIKINAWIAAAALAGMIFDTLRRIQQ